MSASSIDPRWPKVLSLTVHEFRTPMTVVAGYIRMLLKERAGPVSEAQRRLLEEAEKSCARLSALLTEVSDLSALEAGTATFNRAAVRLGTVLEEAIAALPIVPDREIGVELTLPPDVDGQVTADATRLRMAFTSILAALRREIVSTDRLAVNVSTRDVDGGSVFWIAIAEPESVERLASVNPDELVTFDEWRGGCGLALAVARRVLAACGGRIWSPADGSKASAAIRIERA